MKKEFEMTDLGLLNYFVGMEINQTHEDIFVCQEKFAKNLLKKFNKEGCKIVNTPLVLNQQLTLKDGAPRADQKLYTSIIGSLLYILDCNSNPYYVRDKSSVKVYAKTKSG